ncbi:LysR family transcriptional regulator [Paraburkholderia sp. BCC1885]|uniref:helix-turn-helix domain-containing protein n=1 Tax=Paraburkholderia sp. BCC1885 TaxID=2562669 RepID=UPI00391FBB3D
MLRLGTSLPAHPADGTEGRRQSRLRGLGEPCRCTAYTQSFSQAGRELGLSQPSASRLIAELEKHRRYAPAASHPCSRGDGGWDSAISRESKKSWRTSTTRTTRRGTWTNCAATLRSVPPRALQLGNLFRRHHVL